MDLTTHYMGLQLKNPLVASASPLSADLGNIRHLEDSGAAAIVLPSIFEEQIEADALHETRTAVGLENSAYARGHLPESNQRETQQYLNLIRRAVEAVDIPIIGSLNGTTEEGWISYAKMIEEAGATSLELNVYLIPTDISLTGRDVEQRYLEILRAVRKAVDIPIAIKLGPYFSSMGQVAMEFANAGADALVLFNRFYQPDIDPEALEVVPALQLSDSSELRLRLRWLAILHGRVRLGLAASGGVHTGLDALKAVMVGAQAVQLVSALLRRGPEHLAVVRADLTHWLEEHEYESLAQARGSMSLLRCPDPAAFERANYLHVLQSWRPASAG